MARSRKLDLKKYNFSEVRTNQNGDTKLMQLTQTQLGQGANNDEDDIYPYICTYTYIGRQQKYCNKLKKKN